MSAAVQRDWIWPTCLTHGHDWKHIGGRNAGCGVDTCSCSVPVHECTRCGDCDYGDNAEAETTRRECAELRDMPLTFSDHA